MRLDDATEMPNPLDLSITLPVALLSSASSLSLARTQPSPPTPFAAATGHPSPCRWAQELRLDPLFLPTDPRPSGSPAASPSSSSPTFGRRRTFEDSRAPAPPRPRRCLYRIRCELLFHFPSSPRSFPHASRPFHRGRELLTAGDDADKARATGASYRARQRAPHLTRNLTHTLASPPVPPNANPDLARTPAAASLAAADATANPNSSGLLHWMRTSSSSL
mgnify:CR=1 FL=1